MGKTRKILLGSRIAPSAKALGTWYVLRRLEEKGKRCRREMEICTKQKRGGSWTGWVATLEIN